MKNDILVLIKQFIENVKISNEQTDNFDKSANKMHNAAIDQYRKIAKKISHNSVSVCEEFMSLLQSDDENVAVACAVCIIELMTSTPDQYNLAVKRIEEFVKMSKNKMKVLGFEMYLKKLKRT